MQSQPFCPWRGFSFGSLLTTKVITAVSHMTQTFSMEENEEATRWGQAAFLLDKCWAGGTGG